MSVTFRLEGQPTHAVTEECDECHGKGHVEWEEGINECPYCLGKGSFTWMEVTEPFFDINWSNLNAARILSSLAIEAEDLCGRWPVDTLPDMVRKIEAAASFVKYSGIVRPTIVDGNLTTIGVNEEGARERLDRLKALVQMGIDHQMAVVYS